MGELLCPAEDAEEEKSDGEDVRLALAVLRAGATEHGISAGLMIRDFLLIMGGIDVLFPLVG